MRHRLQNSYRIAIAGLLVAWLWDFYVIIKGIYYQLEYPLVEDFFPQPFSTPLVLPVLFLLPLVMLVPALRSENRRYLTVQAGCLVVCCAWLVLHRATFWQPTFSYSFWVALWLLWVARRLDDNADEATIKQAALLAQIILALMFLGRAAGKWTETYWSGEVMYDVMFRYHRTAKFVWLKDMFRPESLSAIATAYSRILIVVETALAFTFLLPGRVAFPVLSFGLVGLWAAATLDSIVWIGPLLALAVAGGYLVHTSAPPRDPGPGTC